MYDLQMDAKAWKKQIEPYTEDLTGLHTLSQSHLSAHGVAAKYKKETPIDTTTSPIHQAAAKPVLEPLSFEVIKEKLDKKAFANLL